MKVNPPREVMRTVRRNGGEIDRGLTRFDHERNGRVLELTAFWPEKTGYDDVKEHATDVIETPPLISTAVSYCVTHQATDHEGRAFADCRFRQLFYFENPMDEHTLMWSDEIAATHA